MQKRNEIFLMVLLVISVLALSSCLSSPELSDPEDPGPTPPEPEPEPIAVGTGLLGSYFDSTTAERVLVRNDSQINFYWATGQSPHSNVPHDYFSIVWEGQLRAPEDGNYILSVRVDDGVRVFIDGNMIIESWQNQGGPEGQEPLYESELINLHRVELRNLRIEYYEANWSAAIRLYWRKEGENQSNMTIIPTEFLYPASSPASQMPQGAAAAPTVSTDPVPPSSSEFGARHVPRSKNPSSNDKWVSTSGSGTACTQSNPCALQTGISQGGFIWLINGTYNYNGQLSLGSGRTLEAYYAKGATIDFGNSANSRITLGSDNVIRNIIVRGASQAGIMVFGNNNLLHGVISEYHRGSGFQTWPQGWSGYGDTKNPQGGSYNNFTDSIGRFNNDCPSTTCNDSDADGISISAGRGNRIIHFTAYANSDDGIDLWASYESIVENSVAYDNGFTSTGTRIGNGMQFKLGSSPDYASYSPDPNRHTIKNNWAYGRHVGYFSLNGARRSGFLEISGSVCGTNRTPCDP